MKTTKINLSLKYVVVFVIIIAVIMVLITFFMPFQNCYEGLIPTEMNSKKIIELTKKDIIDMTTNDLNNFIVSLTESSLSDMVAQLQNLKIQLNKLNNDPIDPLTEDEFNNIITKQIIEIGPTDIHTNIIAFYDKIMGFMMTRNNSMADFDNFNNLSATIVNIFNSQKTSYPMVFIGIYQISKIKKDPDSFRYQITNPLTLKTIDKVTGLPLDSSPTPAPEAPTTAPTTAPTSIPQSMPTTTTPEIQSAIQSPVTNYIMDSCISINNRYACKNSKDIESRSCHWRTDKNDCVPRIINYSY